MDNSAKVKVSIITAAPHVRNYGSILLTYATQKLFEQHGCEAEIVDYSRRTVEESETFADLLNAIKERDFFKKKGSLIQVIAAFFLWPSINRTTKAFKEFVAQYLFVSPCAYFSESDLENKIPSADIYCTGGDQMWNEQHNGHKTLSAFYLAFAPDNKVKISLSTSLGKNEFDTWEIPEVLPLLKQYDLISVRERSAKEYLTSLGLERVNHILDPTLMIDRNDWERLTTPRLIPEDYILIYEISRRSNLSHYVEVLKKKTKKKLVRINYYWMDALKSGKSVLSPTPNEFLSLFRYADMVITNSFHGTVFSIIFQRQFAFLAGANPSRVKNMLDVLGLEEQICTDPQQVEYYMQNKIDYAPVMERLSQAKTECSAFIEQAKALIAKNKGRYQDEHM